MLTDTAYMGLPDEAQTDDLYGVIRLRLTETEQDIHDVITGTNTRGTIIHNLSGQRITLPESQLPKGIYIITNGGDTHKVIRR